MKTTALDWAYDHGRRFERARIVAEIALEPEAAPAPVEAADHRAADHWMHRSAVLKEALEELLDMVDRNSERTTSPRWVMALPSIIDKARQALAGDPATDGPYPEEAETFEVTIP